MYRLKKLDLATVALYSFLIFLILGILFFLPFALLMVFISNMIPEMPADMAQPFALTGIFSGMFLVILPLGYAVFGTIVNIIIALVYNLLSIKLGGIKIQLDHIEAA